MAAVRGRDTKPETSLRRAIHAMGLRYRLNVRGLPGTPDLVFRKHRAVIFVHGCFWHGHDCRLFVVPKTRTEFWLAKISANRARDRKNHATLLGSGWRVATVWECAMRGRESLGLQNAAAEIATFLLTNTSEEMHVRENGAHSGSGYETPSSSHSENCTH